MLQSPEDLNKLLSRILRVILCGIVAEHFITRKSWCFSMLSLLNLMVFMVAEQRRMIKRCILDLLFSLQQENLRQISPICPKRLRHPHLHKPRLLQLQLPLQRPQKSTCSHLCHPEFLQFLEMHPIPRNIDLNDCGI